ncbi:MAG: hypothetical protein Q7R45_04175, partial [Sulfuricaulis sp.]|nr:hypothetical protein [Sulfuricaulis sp.]
MMKRIHLAILLIALCACTPQNLFGPTPFAPTSDDPANISAPSGADVPTYLPTDTSTPIESLSAPTATSVGDSIWIGAAVPPALAQSALSAGFALALNESGATVELDVTTEPGTTWIYALVAPFPTGTDDVPLADIESSWKGEQAGPFAGRAIWMSDSTRAAFAFAWGEPAAGSVQSAPADQLVDAAWADRPSWAIVPFEEIEPRWKVLSVDGQSPIHKN